MNNKPHVPPERRLPLRRRDQILRSVLSEEEPMSERQSHLFRWIAPIVVAAAVALIAVGVVTLTGNESPSGEGPAQPAGQPDPETVPLDLGPLPDDVAQAQSERCAKGFDARGGEYTVPLARRMDGLSGPTPVVVAVSESTGLISTAVCTDEVQVGTTRRSVAPDDQRPIVSVAGEYAERDPWKDAWGTSGVYRVAHSIDRVEVRVGTPDGPEPWRASRVHNGYVYWAAWFEDASYGPGDEVWLEWRAYDTDGNLVDPELMPDQPRRLRMTPPKPDPKPEGAADYEEVRDLLFEVAKDHLDPQGEHLETTGGRSGSGSERTGWDVVGPDFTWTNPGESGVGQVSVSLGAPDTYNDDELQAYAGCHHIDCHRQKLGNDGWAWVGEADGRVSVAYTQPDGEIVYVNVDPASGKYGGPVSSIDITVEQALDFVTDERLDLPIG